jgi:adenine-specific DNA-methyltransferase
MPFLNQVSPEQRPNLCYDIVNPSTGEKLYPTRKAWRSEKRVYEKYVAEGRVWWGKDGTAKVPSIKKFLAEARKGMTPINLWKHDFAGNTDDANREIIELFGDKVFDTPKPIQLIRRMIELTTTEDSNDTVLDFFAGSCTTAHAVLAQNQEDGGNRNFICVQLPQVVEETSVAYKNGLKTIAQIGKERIRKAIDKIKKDVNAHPDLFADRETDLDLGFGVYILSSSNFRIWDASIAKEKQAVEEQLALHIDHIDKKRSQEDILYELLLKTGFPLTTKVDQLTLAGKTVYSVSDGAMLICLERELTPEVIKAMAEKQPIRVVCLDEGFKGNDQLKTNAVQIMKSKNITMFRTV